MVPASGRRVQAPDGTLEKSIVPICDKPAGLLSPGDTLKESLKGIGGSLINNRSVAEGGRHPGLAFRDCARLAGSTTTWPTS